MLSLENKLKIYGEDHIEYASTLGSLAEVLNNLGDY